jgi:proteasome lid subunit RPN8/RPN11
MKYLEDFMAHAESSDKEACGLVVNYRGKLVYYKCTNISSNSTDEFIIDPIDFVKAESMGDITYICHSHVNVSEKPSKVDIISCNRGKTTWLIYSTISKNIFTLEPENKIPSLFGREYVYNVQDCWTLVRDIYKLELNIEIPRMVIDSNFNWYLDSSKNYFAQYASEAGFYRVVDKSIKKYDVLLFMTDKAVVPNHAAVYYDNNIIAHHAYNRLSSKDIFGGYWLKSVQDTYRYRGR